MAFRRARRRAGFRRTGNRASKFGGTRRGARYQEWISLFRNDQEGTGFYNSYINVWNTFAVGDQPAGGGAGNTITRFVTLLPEDLGAGGDVTLVRVVGDLLYNLAFATDDELVGALNLLCTFTVQLAQVNQETIAGVVTPVMVAYPPTLALAQEKSNILWQLTVDLGGTLRVPGNTVLLTAPGGELQASVRSAYPIDITVKRRWDRSQYRLIFTTTLDTVNEGALLLSDAFGIALNLRGLFLTQGGI